MDLLGRQDYVFIVRKYNYILGRYGLHHLEYIFGTGIHCLAARYDRRRPEAAEYIYQAVAGGYSDNGRVRSRHSLFLHLQKVLVLLIHVPDANLVQRAQFGTEVYNIAGFQGMNVYADCRIIAHDD